MAMKEQPLIDAASDPDPLPSFLFANSIVAGIFSILMSAIFGSVFWSIQAVGRGTAAALAVFDIARVGAIGGLVLGIIAHLVVFATAVATSEDKTSRLLFFFGGCMGLASLVAADLFFLDDVRALLVNAPPIVRNALTGR